MAAALIDITSIVREVLHDQDIQLQPSSSFDDIQGWEPMDLVSVVVEIECRLGLEFDLPDIDRIETVGDLVRLIESKQGLVA